MATAAAIKSTHVKTERERDAERKRSDREDKREVIIPKCANRRRRKRLEANDVAWLMHYFGTDSEVRDPFWYSFTQQQIEMIYAIGSVVKFGGDQAVAASRGEGKTTIFERMLTKYTLQGVLSFSVLFAATGSAAEDSLDSIKTAMEENPLLTEDYPEVCVPVQALENTPNRAHYQIVSGFRHDNGKPFKRAASKFNWCGQEIIFPKVPGSPSSQALIATRGLDSAVRGLKRKGRRPQLLGIDDPDTEDTARSPDQAKKLEDRIDRALGGLGGQQRGASRVMLTTLQNRICASYRFTDPEQKPAWKGKRFRYLIKPPTNTELWEEYVQSRQAELQAFAVGTNDDEYCRGSHQFYLDNRAAMDEGAEVANKNRFNPEKMPDGSQVEVSALEHYYNEVARVGEEAVATELDNNPPEESGPIESGITPHRIQTQVNGYPRRTVPPGCTKLTRGVDCRKTALHWVVRAWRPDGTGYTIDYGVHEVLGTIYGSDDGLDVALKRAILGFLEENNKVPYCEADGTHRKIDRTLIDAAWRTSAVYAACSEAGLGVSPVMGFGKSSGCVQVNFSDMQHTTFDRKPGDGWFLSRKGKMWQGKLWLVCADTDRWKTWEHDRWMTSPTKPGCMTLFGESSADHKRLSLDEKAHHSYARHLCNEVEVEEPHKGGIRRHFRAKSDNTHWLDASYYADVAANMEGIRIIQFAMPDDPKPPGPGGWFAAQSKPNRRRSA